MRLTVNFHHDGNFVPSPLMYQEGEKSTIRDLEFEGMTVIRLSKLLQGTCMFPVKGIFFLIPGKELSNGLIEIKNDLDLANCIAVGYKNGKVVDMFLEHHGSINDPFLNKLSNRSYINDFTDKSDGGESSQPSAKEVEIDSDDEDVDKNFKLVDGVIYPEFDPKLPWNEMKPTLGLRELGEGRSGGKKGKKEDWPYEKEKNEGELPKKDKGVLLRSPTKGKKRAYIRSPSKKGVQGQSSADKGKAEDLQGESVAKKGKKKGTKKGVNGCTFRLWASWMQDGSCFQTKTLIPKHTCSRNFELAIKKKYLINVSVGQCKRAKQRSLFDHEGGLIEHYSRLWDYRKQLLDTNPGSSAHLHVDELDNGTCRGELLTAMGRDVNNQMFLIVWAVVSVETIDNWEWFLVCLCEDLRLDSGASLTGLMESVKNLLPHAEHRQCARHIYANFKKKWNGLHFKSLFWLAATTTIQHTFYSKMNLIGNIDPEAKQWLVDRNPNSWCRAFFKMDRGCAAYENGISESYHNAIRIARVYPCGNNEYEIRKGDTSYGVNIENRTCACKWWDLSGVPCVHSVAAFSFLKMDPVLGVSACRPRKLRIKHVTKRVNVITRSGRMMTCHNCWEKGHNKKSCKNEKQSQLTVEKRTPGRKKVDSNFVFPTGGKNGGDAGPSIADPTDSEAGDTDELNRRPWSNPSCDIQIPKSKTCVGKYCQVNLGCHCNWEVENCWP
ncbi:60S ribosomal protein L34 [Tanacetum coccineum]|uniref:60S ribosomal protein L34 n=1 Tax=Tanacetum coccineum TaxID=301880 RepID=A0ABQ5EL58_9ASTR